METDDIRTPSWPSLSYPFGSVDRYRARGPHIGHQLHLCEMTAKGEVSLDQMKALVRDPKFICSTCGRAATDELHLCDPVPL